MALGGGPGKAEAGLWAGSTRQGASRLWQTLRSPTPPARVIVLHKHPPSTSATHGKLVRREVVFFQRRDWIFESHAFLPAQRKRLALASRPGGQESAFPLQLQPHEGGEPGQAGRQGRGTRAAFRRTSSTAPSPLGVCRSLPPTCPEARAGGRAAPRSRHPRGLSPQSKGPDSTAGR